MPKYVYDFAEGNRSMADLLGGKGANLAEMTVMGLPVPPGFTITTEACRAYLATGASPDGLAAEVDEHLHALERAMGRKLGQVDQPLLVAVRSGARFSMPGMMDTVLDIGITDDSVAGLAAWSGDERLAWDSYRRLVQMFGQTVLGVDGALFAGALRAAKRAKGVDGDLGLDAGDLRELTTTFKNIVRTHAGSEFPQDPREQLDLAITAVFASWHTDRARSYRRTEHIPEDLGTAVNVCAMVFGNLGENSGTGVAFTRDPATGAPGVYGDYLANAQGEDVVAGIRNTLPLHRLATLHPKPYEQLLTIMRTLEEHYRDLCDIEFTIERGRLWMLQTRVGKRTAAAAFRVADALREEGLIDADEALRRVTGTQLAQLMFPRFADTTREPLATGVAASPGAAVGEVVFDSATAVRRTQQGAAVILVRRETNPDDLDGLIHAQGVLTSRGGKTSHAAVVIPGLYDMQVRAIAEATAARVHAGGQPHVEIMIPLVGAARELEIVTARAKTVVAKVATESGVDIPHEIGTMIELPRAALTAAHLAATAQFFSFGTNDLTQTVWGFPRDDAEASFFPTYLTEGVFTASPFETIDHDGVGQLITLAVREGRTVRPDLAHGVCGEHGGDPASIKFFHQAGLDYVSCSPFRVPIARLEAGRAAVGDSTTDTR